MTHLGEVLMTKENPVMPAPRYQGTKLASFSCFAAESSELLLIYFLLNFILGDKFFDQFRFSLNKWAHRA